MICNCKSRVKNEPISHFLFALFIPDKEMKGLLHRRAIQMSMFCLIRETGATPPKARTVGTMLHSSPARGALARGTWASMGRGGCPPALEACSSPAPSPLLSSPPSRGRALVHHFHPRVAWTRQWGGNGCPEPVEAVPGGGGWRCSFPPSWQGTERGGDKCSS